MFTLGSKYRSPGRVNPSLAKKLRYSLKLSYSIEACYLELELPGKALIYLKIATSFSDNIKYMQEYINCLSITKYIRTNFLIDTEGEKLFKKSKELWTTMTIHIMVSFFVENLMY